MATKEITNTDKLKRAFWLAFQASSAMGMGFLHAKAASSITEDSLFKDYGDGDDDEINTDYVYGRMMKTTFCIRDNKLVITPETPRSDYQSWARKYPTATALIAATEESFK